MVIHQNLDFCYVYHTKLADHEVKQEDQSRFHQENLLLLAKPSEWVDRKVDLQKSIESKYDVNDLNSSPEQKFSNQKREANLDEHRDGQEQIFVHFFPLDLWVDFVDVITI